MASKLQTAFFFLILVAIPLQLGKHFWPNFAYVNGVRVDYLSPTIYISDVFVVILLISLFFNKHFKLGRVELLGILGTILYLSLGIYFSSFPLNGWYSLLKFIELTFFAYFVGKEITDKKTLLFFAFCLGIIIEGALSLTQIVRQASVGGFWYFLGERTFSSSTPGIANASIQGQLFLRPYATFPHPNVLAGYLVIALLFLLTWIFATKNTSQKLISIILLIFGSGILLLTLSRVAIVVFVILATVVIFKNIKSTIKKIILAGAYVMLVIILAGTLIAGRFLDLSSYRETIFLRDVLIQASLQMFLSHPFFGVGLGNFLPLLPRFISLGIIFSFLQPVHNIFLLVLTETGVIGLSIFLWILYLAYSNVLKNLDYYSSRKTKPNREVFDSQTVGLYQFALLSFIAICAIGLTDHYFLTLQQGQLLFALVLGVCFSKGNLTNFIRN